MLLTAIIYTVISLLSILILLYIIYRALRRLISWGVASSVFGGDAKTCLLSLGLASIPFATILPTMVKATVKFIADIVFTVPSRLYVNWQSNYQMLSQNGTNAQSVVELGFGFVGSWTSSINQAYKGIPEGIPYISFIFMLALWVLIAYILGQQTFDGGRPIVRGRIWLQNVYNYSRLNPSAVYNLIFFLILGLGAYFSIAAITAIPSLQEDIAEPETVSINRLKSELEGMQGQFANNVRNNNDFPNNPFEGSEQLEQMEDPKTQTTSQQKNNEGETQANQTEETNKPRTNNVVPTSGAEEDSQKQKAEPEGETPPPPNLERIRGMLTQEKLKREAVLVLHKRMVAQAMGNLQVDINTGLSTYSADISRKGSRERAKHFLKISNWYNKLSGYYLRDINNCSSYISFLDTRWKVWVNELREDIAAGRYTVAESNRPPNVDDSLNQYCRFYESHPEEKSVPARESLGSDLGAFRYLVGWLLQTESLAMALITGLFGFGLLGSACSTFVREREQKRKPGASLFGLQTSGGVIVEDLTGVVIRGVSAAIVVFLAVEGGLAIFASPNSQPNSYVLLLTCLVAAVFSEVIWKWAQNWITSYFSKETESGNQQGSTAMVGTELGTSEQPTDDKATYDTATNNPPSNETSGTTDTKDAAENSRSAETVDGGTGNVNDQTDSTKSPD